MVILDKIDFKTKAVKRDKEGHYILIKGSIQEDITIINIYAPNIGAPQYVRQMLTNMKVEINNNTIIVGDFNTLLNGTPLQHSCLENPMDRGAWKATVHGVAQNWTRLSEFTFTFHFHALETEMATHPSVLAWRIPGMGEPGGLLSMGSHRVRHD